MKKKITDLNAVAAVMDIVFQQVEERWPEIWNPVVEALNARRIPHASHEFVRFNYSLAVLAINFRSAFDIFPRDQAEHLFTHFQRLLKKNLGDGAGFHAVQNSVVKYIDAYNNGILNIRNPIHDVAMLLYYKIGMDNTEQKVVDEAYYIPEPKIVEYLTKSLTLFTGKWEMLLGKYEVVFSSGRAPNDP
ncbi:MAG: hypothetical protein AAF570_01240 [Bacteroidota bacterium]